MEEKNEVARTFGEALTDKLVSVEAALPKEFNRTRFVQNALSVLNEKPELAKVNKNQLMMGLLKGAYLNLDYSNREFYLLPYGSSVNFQFDYRGLQKVAKQYSIRPIKEIHSEVVREGDKFQVGIVDNKQIINFEKKPFSDAPIVGVFAYIEYVDGSVICETMSTQEVNDVRTKYSKQSNGGAWVKSWDQMARKSVIRRLLKTVDISFENAEARKVYSEEADADFTIKKPVTPSVVDVFNKNAEPDVIDSVATEVVEGE